MTKHEHYNTEQPKSKETEISFEVEIPNKNLGETIILKIQSSSSIFSKNKIDLGTYNFIRYGNFEYDKANAKVLDLGCGYGIIGLALKKFYPSYDLTLSDINERAIKISRNNAKDNNVEITVKKSDIFEKFKDDTFDIIVTNPPYISGRKVINQIITESIDHLNKGGYIEVVVKYGKGGKYLEGLMNEVYGNVETIAKKSGYRILKSVNH